MRLALTMVFVFVSVSIASADPTSPDLAPRLYSTASLGAAILHTRQEPDTEFSEPAVTDLRLLAHLALGLELGPRDHGMNGRVGLFADGYEPGRGQYGKAALVYGLEAQLDWNLDACWRLGFQLAGGKAFADGATLDGNAVMAGVHVRTRHVNLALDAFVARSTRSAPFRSSTDGIIVTGGIEGRPALIAIGGAAVVAGIASLVLWSLFAST